MTNYLYGGYRHDRELPTPHQFAAARTVCGLGLRELAKLADTSTVTIQRYEKHRKPIAPVIAERLRAVFEQRGIEFTFGERAGITFKLDAVGIEWQPPMQATSYSLLRN